MAHRHKIQARNVGGGVDLASGNKDVVKAAKKKKGGFQRGGSIPGFKSGGRLDKRARGGGTSPFSSAKTSEKGNLTSSGGTKARP